MKKKILLPIDFSKNSWTTIVYASELYKDKEVDFFLLNAFNASTYTLDSLMAPEPGEPIYEKKKEESLLKLEKLSIKIKQHSKNAKHTYYIACMYNSPIEAVKNTIESKDIELVVISNKGETNNKNITMGSNTVDMMEKIRNCPVLMVPSNTEFKAPNEIVFPTSFKTHFKRRELEHLYEIASITNAPIRILHISQGKKLSLAQNDKKALLEECLEGLDYSFHYLKNTDVNTGLDLFVQSRASEMISFINKKHAFFGSILTRPMVKELGDSATVPVLALHDLRN